MQPTNEHLLDLLALAADAVEGFIDDDPEAAGSKFIDTGCQECTEGNTPAAHDRGLCWLHQARKILRRQPAPENVSEGQSEPSSPITYRIEKRSDEGPTEYWYADVGGFWTTTKEAATIYTELERTEILNKTLKSEPVDFPEGGIWVRVEAA